MRTTRILLVGEREATVDVALEGARNVTVGVAYNAEPEITNETDPSTVSFQDTFTVRDTNETEVTGTLSFDGIVPETVTVVAFNPETDSVESIDIVEPEIDDFAVRGVDFGSKEVTVDIGLNGFSSARVGLFFGDTDTGITSGDTEDEIDYDTVKEASGDTNDVVSLTFSLDSALTTELTVVASPAAFNQVLAVQTVTRTLPELVTEATIEPTTASVTFDTDQLTELRVGVVYNELGDVSVGVPRRKVNFDETKRVTGHTPGQPTTVTFNPESQAVTQAFFVIVASKTGEVVAIADAQRGQITYFNSVRISADQASVIGSAPTETTATLGVVFAPSDRYQNTYEFGDDASDVEFQTTETVTLDTDSTTKQFSHDSQTEVTAILLDTATNKVLDLSGDTRSVEASTPTLNGGSLEATPSLEQEPGLADREVYAKVGQLEFDDRFSDPKVDTRQRINTADHELVAGGGSQEDFVVQKISKRPPEVTINGVVTATQLATVDGLRDQDVVRVRSHRWTGEAIVTDIQTTDIQAYYEDYRLHEVTLTLKGLNQSYTPKTG